MNRAKRLWLISVFILIFHSGCDLQPVFATEITASWYSKQSLKNEGTWKYSKGIMANGELYNENKYTCANRIYPLGTMLKITNISNGKSVIVKTTDRIGKRFAETRIDLSKSAFNKIENLNKGLTKVKVEVVK